MRLKRPPITHSDKPFLLTLYASVRAEEMALVPWNEEQKKSFLEFQFQAQHDHYTNEYPHGSFQTIELEDEKVGRLYTCELDDEFRIIELTIAPAYRRKGIGSEILTDILNKSTKPVRIYLENFNRFKGLFERFGFRVIRDEGLYQLWECPAVGEKNLNAVA